MKTPINLSIEKDLVKQIKSYAEKRQTSVSDLVEAYFTKIVRSGKKSNIISLIESLDRPAIAQETDLKKEFYEQQASKYGI